jgi:GNAT superfamily N-acetyltransferase
MSFVAQHDPLSVEELTDYAQHGRSWVATDPDGRPVGYLIADEVDRCAHIEQVSVEPDFQGRGVGKALIASVEIWAVGRGLRALTLTTFREVPWNMPLYEHLGFSEVLEPELSRGLKEIRDAEAERGLDPQTRVCMLRPLA